MVVVKRPWTKTRIPILHHINWPLGKIWASEPQIGYIPYLDIEMAQNGHFGHISSKIGRRHHIQRQILHEDPL